MKKLTLIFALLLALVGLKANAAMYVVGSAPFGGWDPTQGMEMTMDKDGIYYLDVTFVEDNVWFVFSEQIGSWDAVNGHRYDPGTGSDMSVTADVEFTTVQGNTNKSFAFEGKAGEKYTFTFNPITLKAKVAGYQEPLVYTSFTVAGNNADIFGSTWNVTNTDNDMTLDETDGLYKLVKENVEIPGNYTLYYKVAANHAWAHSWGNPAGPDGNQDYYFSEAGTYNLTFKFDLENEIVSLDAVPVQVGPVEEDIYIFGDVNDFAWDPTQGVLMTFADDVYTATVNATMRENQEKAYIGFTKKLADATSETPWDDIAPYRFGPVSEGAFVMTEELLGTECALATDGSYESIALPEGEWTITVDRVNNKFTVNGTWPVDTVIPEPEPNVYIIGDVNDYAWDPTQGVLMTFADSVYTATVNATKRENEEKAYIGFTKMLADSVSENVWNEIAPYRFGPVSEGAFVMTEELLGVECALATDGSYESIALPEGTWTVTVDLANNKFSVNGTWPIDTVTPEPETDLYIIGEVNDNGGWFTNKGVKMTLNEGVYTANITTAGENEGLSYFSFTKQLADSAADWEAIAPYRIGAVSEGDFVMTEELLGVECALVNNGEAIALPAGEWTVNVNLDTYKFTITGEWPVDTIIPEPETDLYIIGEVNDNGGWFTNKGVKMTLNEGVYTADISTAGENNGMSYFSFTKQLADSAADWDAIAPYRIGAVSDGDFWMTEELLGVECALVDNGQSIALPAGEWTVTVNLDTYKFTITGEWPEVPGPEPYDGDVYIIGEVNDNGGWFTNKGVLMTRDAENNLYTATITTAGENVPEGEEAGYSYFSFTKQLADSAADWEAIAPYRFGAVSDGDYWVTEETLGTEIALMNNGQSFRVPAGTWDLTLSVDNMTLVINKKTFELGDVNHDGYVDIADVTTLISIVLKKANYPAEADVNSDGEATIADVTILIGRVLAGHW